MSKKVEIQETARSFQHWDSEVQRLELELVEAKRKRCDYRERMLEAITRYELDEV